MDKQEQIGFHKGSLATLTKEYQELIRLVKITEELMKAHMKGLKNLGVDLEQEARKAKEKFNLDEKLS